MEAALQDKAEKLRVKNGFCERDHCLGDGANMYFVGFSSK